MKKIILPATLIIVVLVIIAVFFLPKILNTTPVKLTKVSVRLDWLNTAEFAGLYVAQEKGFYKKAGIDAQFLELSEGLDLAGEVASGKSEFGISTGTEIIYSIGQGSKIKALASFYQTTPEVFVSLKSANIESLSDYKGKVLGILAGNKEAVVLYKALLAKANLTANDVTMKELDYSVDVPGILTQGLADVVDTYRTDETYQLDKKGVEYNQLLPENYGISIYGDTLITSQHLIDTNRELVSGFVKATILGWQYALDHHDEALDITSKYQNETYQDHDLENYILTQSALLIKPTKASAIGSMSYANWNKAIKEMESAGLINRGLNATTVYTTEFLPLQ